MNGDTKWVCSVTKKSHKMWDKLSGCPDSNRGPHRPERCALPGCATPRRSLAVYRKQESKTKSEFMSEHPVTLTDRVRAITRTFMSTLGNTLFRMGIHPDVITILGFLIVIVAAVFIGRGQLQLGGIILMLALPLRCGGWRSCPSDAT